MRGCAHVTVVLSIAVAAADAVLSVGRNVHSVSAVPLSRPPSPSITSLWGRCWSCGTPIVVVQAAQDGNGHDGCRRWLHRALLLRFIGDRLPDPSLPCSWLHWRPLRARAFSSWAWSTAGGGHRRRAVSRRLPRNVENRDHHVAPSHCVTRGSKEAMALRHITLSLRMPNRAQCLVEARMATGAMTGLHHDYRRAA